MNNKPLIYILRGRSDSLREEVAFDLWEHTGASVCSASYFDSTPEKSTTACWDSFCISLDEGSEVIVVDNPNLTLKDYQHYVDLGVLNGYNIRVLSVEGVE
tara:strand:- start:6416 stop:6718 length:303 start_codon:yes stop_codon:yes gene_type:complete